jgi:hypothetical protein
MEIGKNKMLHDLRGIRRRMAWSREGDGVRGDVDSDLRDRFIMVSRLGSHLLPRVVEFASV